MLYVQQTTNKLGYAKSDIQIHEKDVSTKTNNPKRSLLLRNLVLVFSISGISTHVRQDFQGIDEVQVTVQNMLPITDGKIMVSISETL